jgi:hypothetical protein
MRSAQSITLFSQQADSDQHSFSWMVSLLLHGMLAAVVAYGMAYAPKLNAHVQTSRSAMRQIELQQTDPLPHPQTETFSYSPFSTAESRVPGLNRTKRAERNRPEERAQSLAPTLQSARMLWQPSLQAPLAQPVRIPVPSMMIWNAEKTRVKLIVPPLPKPRAADTTPSLEAPNEEIHLAEHSLSSVVLPTPSLKSKIVPGTSTPVAIHDAQPVQAAPATVTQTTATPTPAAVLSLSELRMEKGSVTLPPMNSAGQAMGNGATSSGSVAHAGDGSTGSGIEKEGGKETKGSGGDKQGSHSASSADNGAGHGADYGANVAGDDSARVASTANGQKDAATVARWSLPKDGHFGAVIVGAALPQNDPEATAIWSGRPAYTVYLHVGLAKSWILQYSLPKNAAAAENLVRLEAPWPYEIVRPNLKAEAMDADTLIVHGFISLEGRFEALNLVYPQQFSQTQFLLGSLAQWRFRPAAQNGKPVRVEALLVIPEEQE